MQKKYLIPIIALILLVIIGIIVIIILKTGTHKSDNNDSEQPSLIILDIPEKNTEPQISEPSNKEEPKSDSAISNQTKKQDNKTVDNNKSVGDKTVTSEKQSEKESAKADNPIVISDSPAGSSQQPSLNPNNNSEKTSVEDKVIELPFVPYEKIEN